MSDPIEQLNLALQDRYRIERELGRGGMAVVYLAHDVRHERQVAVKVLEREVTSAVGAERFLREIQIAARLQHPHVIPLFDSGEAAGHLFFVMPYVEGETLRDRLDRETQLATDEAVRRLREIASALEYAHGQGVVHRDLKPENVLISAGYGVLADFGVARAISESGSARLTGGGLAMGSPQYMAPELLDQGTQPDGRADLYSLGCVAYEMLAGAPPFSGPTTRVVLARHANDPVPPLRTARPSVPPALEALVLRLLEKVPADRFASAGEVLTAIDEIVAGGLPREAPVTPSRPATVPVPGAPERRGPSADRGGTTPAGAPVNAAGAAPGPGIRSEVAPVGAPEDRSFFAELKRRNVYKAAVVYIAVAFGLIQAAELTFPTFGMEWAFDYVVMTAALGFPIVMVFAWAYDLTRGGLRRATPMGVAVPTGELTITGAQRRRARRWLLATAGLITFAVLFPFSYGGPARVPIDVSENDARGTVQDFMRDQGVAGSFDEAAIFETQTERVVYLQRLFGIGEAQRRLDASMDPWRWHFRWFQPQQTEEFRAAVGDGGRVVGFSHIQEENAQGGHPTEAEALAAALRFLRTYGWDPEALEAAASSSTSRPNRTDHSFAWYLPHEAPDDAATAAIRTKVTIDLHGAVVAGYQTELELPESFTRERSRADFIAGSLLAVMFGGSWIGLLILLVRAGRGGRVQVRWQNAITVALVGGAFMVVRLASQWPQELFSSYSTETPMVGHFVFQILGWVLVGVLLAGVTFVFAAALDGYGRTEYPERMAGWNDLLRGRVRSPALAEEVQNGFVLGFILLGLSTLLVAVQSWTPGSSGLVLWNGADDYAHSIRPALSAMTDQMAFVIIFGIFLGAIVVVLRRSLRSTAMAVVLPAVALSLAFTAEQPVYLVAAAHSLEVLAVTIGVVRFGPVAVVVALYLSEIVPVGIAWIAWPELGLVGDGVVLLFLALLPAIPIFMTRQEAPAQVAERLEPVAAGH